jgi:hypothetical protein
MCPPSRSRPNGCRTSSLGQLRSLAEVVADYRASGARDARDELRFYRGLPSLRAAVHAAGHALAGPEKRHSHQYTRPGAVLRKCAALLELQLSTIRHAQSFEKPHRIIEDTIGALRGVGPLMVYDTALRIGAKLGLEPNVVFLHAGVQDGARNLGLDATAAWLEMAAVPKELRHLRPLEAEDVLCIYKDEFRRLVGVSGQSLHAS